MVYTDISFKKLTLIHDMLTLGCQPRKILWAIFEVDKIKT